MSEEFQLNFDGFSALLDAIKADEASLLKLTKPATKLELVEVVMLMMEAQTTLLNAILLVALGDVKEVRATADTLKANLTRSLKLVSKMVDPDQAEILGETPK